MSPARRRLAAALCCAALFGGCSVLPARAPSAGKPAPDRFDIDGRIAIRAEKNAFSASLHWTQDADAYALRLSGPLGQGTVEISGDAGGVTLRSADARMLQAPDPQTLMQRELGWSLPVAGLRWWVRGLPDPQAAVDDLQIDAAGHTRMLEQSGWRIELSDYATSGNYLVPVRLVLTSARATLRLAVRRWTIP
ncbi:MAG: lipoprotein insertase outer membrane protein LolB [Gammaproteobacteria bacterium]